MSDEIRVLSAGVDSLYASVGEGVTVDRLAEALEHRGMAQDSQETTVWEVGGLRNFEVMPHSFGRYAVCMRSPAMQVRLGPETEHRPAMVIELRSAFLHQVGVEAAVEEADRLVSYFCPGLWLSGDESPRPVHRRLSLASAQLPGGRLTASRVDLYVDTQGWEPGHEEFMRFVTRANHRRVLEEPRQLHMEGRLVSGFTFGRGDLLCRIYNKTLQLKKKGETWPEAVWQGFDADCPVWRVEFQFRRETLTDFYVDGDRLDTVADVLAMRQGLWEYGSEWLSLREPRPEDRNMHRWPVADLWQRLRATTIGSPCAELVRERVRAANEAQLLAGFCGYASSLAARGYGRKLPETLQRVSPAAEGYLRRKGRSFERVAARKKERHLAL